MVRVVFSYGPTSPRLWAELSADRVVWLPVYHPPFFLTRDFQDKGPMKTCSHSITLALIIFVKVPWPLSASQATTSPSPSADVVFHSAHATGSDLIVRNGR